MTCGFGTTGLSLEEQIYAELVIVQRSSLVYLSEAAMGTRFPILLGAGVLYLEESPKVSELLFPPEAH